MAHQSRTRIISQGKALYVSPTGLIGGLSVDGVNSGMMPQQLHRIDTFSFDIDLAGGRQDVREFGQLARIGTITLGELNPSFSLGYYLGDGENEGNLGFNGIGMTGADVLSSQFISGIVAEDPHKRCKNIFCLTVGEGEDAFTTNGSQYNDNPTGFYTPAERDKHDVVSFGNCYFNSYTVNFSVGEIPRVDIEGVAENVTFDSGSSGIYNPSLGKDGARADTGQLCLGTPSTGNMNVLVLRPEDVTLSFSNTSMDIGGTTYSDMHVQTASIEVPLSRTPIEALGSAKAVSQPLDFPINVTMSISALLKTFTAGQLDLMLTGSAGNETTNITLNVKGDDGNNRHRYILQDAVLDSQGFSTTLDDNESIELVFSSQIGGTNQISQGIFYSGQDSNQADIYAVPVVTSADFPAGFYYDKFNIKEPYNSDK